jgi:hydroxymethylpyrimidine/phosphomethylpyrimidine kinase
VVPRLLTVAGSDSGGGAGIQADLKTFAALGAYGMVAVTAVTAQTTDAVHAVHEVPAALVRRQIETAFGDIGVDAVKTGMLGSAETVVAIAEALAGTGVPLVVDPVLAASNDTRLLPLASERPLVERLFPLATVVTPNRTEARALTGMDLEGGALAEAVQALGSAVAVVTGGAEDGIDWYCDGERTEPIAGPLAHGTATHGTGCTHAAALAVFLVRGHLPLEAARLARELVAQAILDGLSELGRGPGPVDALGLRARGVAPPPYSPDPANT